MNNKRKILFVPSWYSSNENDLSGSFIKDLAKDLIEQGLEVHVIHCQGYQAPRYKPGNIKNLFKSRFTIENGIYTYRLDFIKFLKIDIINKIIWSFLMKRLAKRLLQDQVFDLVHVHSIMWGGAIAKWIYQKYNIPFVITEHRGWFVKGSNYFFSKNDKKEFNEILKYCSRLNLVSDAQRDFFSNYNNITGVIHNYVGEHFLTDEILRSSSDQLRLITVCHLRKLKNVSSLIKATHELHQNGTDVTLTIIGDGKEYASLSKLANSLGITDRVIFLGAKRNEDLNHYLYNADIFVLPSLFESFGIVLIEAMACGLPVVATKNGGPATFIDKSVGRVVDTTNVIEIVNAIEDINSSPIDHERIKDFVRNKFSKSQIIPRIIQGYEEVLN